jgi:hypothetical protein
MRRDRTTLDELITVPVNKHLREVICDLAESEKRKLAPMARILIEEAIEARQQKQSPEPRRHRVSA